MRKKLSLLVIILLCMIQTVRVEAKNVDNAYICPAYDYLQVIARTKNILDTSENKSIYYEVYSLEDNYLEFKSTKLYDNIGDESIGKEYYIVLSQKEYYSVLGCSEDERVIAANILNMGVSEEEKIPEQELSEMIGEQHITIMPVYIVEDTQEIFYIRVTINEHVVIKGDTLSEIAERFSTSVESLTKKNYINNSDLIYEEQLLIL